MRKTILACVAVALIAGTATATATTLITSKQIKDGTIKNADIKSGTIKHQKLKQFTVTRDRLSKQVRRQLEEGGQGPAGPKGDKGDKGDRGPAGFSPFQRVASLSPPFAATNATVSMTPDGVEFGPYADGGATAGSLEYTGANGRTLGDIEGLAYYARYLATDETGGVGAPYLRIFLTAGGTEHDVIFSPNTQPDDPDAEEGPFHNWVVTSGSVRYDDDGGTGPDSPWATIQAAHASEVITGIFVTTGGSAGTNLTALMQTLRVDLAGADPVEYRFG